MGGELFSWMEKVKRLRKTKPTRTKQIRFFKIIEFINTDNIVVVTRGKGGWGWGKAEDCKGRIKGNGRRLDLWW